ncbi:hypothetical protein BDFG_00516 [Blastomyces dermatitidis ATCC 26199]|nr:hypothetical protein BDFG_00516 [Blastomyces dermatitidis ATCC 26199]
MDDIPTMDPQHPRQPFARPSTFGAHPPSESRHTQLPPHLYGPGSLPANGRSHVTYDPLGRRENEIPPRAPPGLPPPSPAYPSHPYHHEIVPHPKPSPSPGPFASLHHEPTSGFHSRHSSRGSVIKSGDGGVKEPSNPRYREAHQPHQPPPPPPTMSSRDMSHPTQPYEHARRRSLGSNGSSPVYPASGQVDQQGGQQPPPPSSSYTSRQMPPPSSPQHYHARGAPIPGLPPPAPSSFPPREPPQPSAHRPGSSMSISSMLGSDSDRPPRDSGPSSIYGRPSVSSVPAGSQQGAMSPPSAPSRQPQPSSDFPPLRRSHTPDRGLFSNPQPPRPYRSSSGSAPQNQPQPPPPEDTSRFGALSRPQSLSSIYGDKPQASQPTPSGLYAVSPYNQDRRGSISGPIPRPSSQPHQEEPPSSRRSLFSPGTRSSGPHFGDGSSKESGLQPAAPGYPGPEAASHAQRRYGIQHQERHCPAEPVSREQEHNGRLSQDMKQQQPRFGSHFGEREPEGAPRPTWDSSGIQRLSPEAARHSISNDFGGMRNTKPLGSQLPGPRSVPGPHLQQQQRPEPSQRNDSQQSSSLNKFQQPSRIFSPTLGPGSGSQRPLGGMGEDQKRKDSNEPFQHRSLLNLNAENKREGRSSPLPQAVQGAQAQIIGPAEEAGIKSELGRVFSGIGSGVGVSAASHPGSGPSTPMTSSPFKRDGIAARSAGAEINESATKPARTSVPGPARRGRKPKDDDMKGEGEGSAGNRGAGTTRGRRPRHVHHHHHHGHHHHHRHKLDDEASGSLALQNAIPPPGVAGFQRPPIHPEGTALSPSTVAPHHHHHHHHHVPRSTTGGTSVVPPSTSTSAAPIREYSTIVNLQPLLRSVAHRPRYHLGSTLYAPKIGVPTSRASPESSKFGYVSTPVPIPRFEGKENCTYTIRVPRFRIDASHREEICARRALWGTGVYTDDSDPVAAAIHSGFIRGEWGEDVDVSLLDLEIKKEHQHAPNGKNGTTTALPKLSSLDELGVKEPKPSDKPETTTTTTTTTTNPTTKSKSKPKIPPLPPPNKDLHITLLILPTLERYDSTVMFGLKSRPWGDNHDGMSFKVERIDWVDEGGSKGEERGGEARRKRLRSMMLSGRICTPGGMKGRGGVELRNGSKIGGMGMRMSMGMDGGEGGIKAVEPVS